MDPDNYNLYEVPGQEQKCTSKISKNTKWDPETNIILSNIPPGSRKAAAENIIPPRTDVKPDVHHARTPVSAWNKI